MGFEYECYYNDELILCSILLCNFYVIDICWLVYGQLKLFFGCDDCNYEEVDVMVFNLQDQIEFSEKWCGLFGVCFDCYCQDMNVMCLNNGCFCDISLQQIQCVVILCIGVLYQVILEVGLFVNVLKFFKFNGGIDMVGKVFDLEEGCGYEVGVKFDLFDGWLGMIFVVFYLKKKNVFIVDLSNFGYQQIVGEVCSQGFDLQFSG